MNSPQLLTYDLGNRVTAFSTTRHGGVSEGAYGEFNINGYCGDDEAHVQANRQLLATQLGVPADRIVLPHQVHGVEVRAVAPELFGLPAAVRAQILEGVDVVMTDMTSVCIGVSTADCIPVLLYDPVAHAAAAIHAGWRGTVGRIGDNVVKKMQSLYGTDPSDIKAAIGPAISVCCYEVDKPCADNFLALDELDSTKFVFPKGNGKFMIDLLETNRQILVHAGVKNENITVSDVCTNCNSELLWSHRATKGHRGTMSAFMCIK